MMEKNILHKHWSSYIKIFTWKQSNRYKKELEDLSILNMCANNWASKYIKQNLTVWKREMEKCMIIIRV